MRQQRNETLANKLRAARYKRKAAIRNLNPNAKFPLDAGGVEAQVNETFIKSLKDEELLRHLADHDDFIVKHLLSRIDGLLERIEKQEDNFNELKTKLSNRVNTLTDLMNEIDEDFDTLAA